MRVTTGTRWPVLCVALAMTPTLTARADDMMRAPEATAEANAATTHAAFGSGCAIGPRGGMCADTIWPPTGLGTPLPVTSGTVVRVTFSRPVSVQNARLGGNDAPFAAESPSVWRFTAPAQLGDGLLAVFTLWRTDDWHGDQMYAIPLRAAAALVRVRGAQATVETRAPGRLRLVLLRRGRVARARTFTVPGAARRAYRLPAAPGAHLRVTFVPMSGGTLVLRA